MAPSGTAEEGEGAGGRSKHGVRHDRHIFFATNHACFPRVEPSDAVANAEDANPQESRMQEGVSAIATTGIMIIIGTIVSPPLFAIAAAEESATMSHYLRRYLLFIGNKQPLFTSKWRLSRTSLPFTPAIKPAN